MSDGGKGSGRRKEDINKVHSNWDLIDWGRKPKTEDNTGTNKNEYYDVLNTEDALAEDEAFEHVLKQNEINNK
jgi:hypothetical protein